MTEQLLAKISILREQLTAKDAEIAELRNKLKAYKYSLEVLDSAYNMSQDSERFHLCDMCKKDFVECNGIKEAWGTADNVICCLGYDFDIAKAKGE